MPQSLSKMLVHLIFSTKNRERWITEDIRPELHPYLNSVFKAVDSPAISIGSVEDHVHILFQLSKNQPVCKVVERTKSSSSKWIKSKGSKFAQFSWQSGYGAFSVSQSHAKEVQNYIANQKEHHRVKSFQEELRSFLNKYEVPYDECYVWD